MSKGVLCTGLSAIEAYNTYEQQKTAAPVPGATPISKKRLVVVNVGNTKEVQLWDLKQVGLFERFKAAIGWRGSSFNLKDVAVTVSKMTQEITQKDAKVYKKFVDNLNFYNGHKTLPGLLHYFQPSVPDTVIKEIDEKAEEAFVKKSYHIGVQFISFVNNHLQSLDELSNVEFSTELLGYLKSELQDVTTKLTNKEQELHVLSTDYPAHGADVKVLLNLIGGERKKIAELTEKWEKRAIPEKPPVEPPTITAKQLEEQGKNIVEESIPFLRGWLSSLQDDVDNDDVSVEMLNTYQDSVNAAEAMLERSLDAAMQLLSDSQTFNADATKELDKFYGWVDTAKSELGALKGEIERLRQEIAEKQHPIDSVEPIHVPGIENAGNSCYMNSALQGLLVSPLIVQKIKAYDKEPVPQDELFMPTLKEFLSAYERYSETPNSENSGAIAKLASTLQTQLYETRLQYLGVEHVHAKAEADLIVSALGQVLGVEYPFITRTQGFCGQEHVISDVRSQALRWTPEIKTSGEPSLQKTFIQQCTIGEPGPRDGEWKYNSQPVFGTNRVYRLGEEPPPLLVFKVGASQGELMDSPFQPYKVTQKDEFFDASTAFDVPHEGGAKYRLISVLENHGRYHWTAKSRHADGWYECNDNRVKRLGQSIPTANAAVMIYERLRT